MLSFLKGFLFPPSLYSLCDPHCVLCSRLGMLSDRALCPGLHWNETVPVSSLNVILAADLDFLDLAIVSTCEILVACDLLVKTRPFLGTSPARVSASLLGASKHLTLFLESWWSLWDLGRHPHLPLSYSIFCGYHHCIVLMLSVLSAACGK